MAPGGFDVEKVRNLLSPSRMRPYLDQTGEDLHNALELYTWSTSMAAAAFETIAHLEIMLRNAIDGALKAHYREELCGIPWFMLRPPMDDERILVVDEVRARLRGAGKETRHQIVAGLPFGFWAGMLGTKYEELWRTALRHAFPGSSGNRKQVGTAVEAIRKFRNKLAHHDSMINIDIPFEMRRVREVAAYVGTDAEAWIQHIDRSTDLYRLRPHSVIDTVVVPALHAWPFYEQHRAYVCQAGRWFQPVDRIAFYADREVKGDVPRILHRRDDVLWSEHEAARLETSPDRHDRKIAAVIRAAREAGWTDGVHQVFLLTRPGDTAHRTLGSTVPHRGAGRGSAFVQRQRYVSLHALETAATTDDLIRRVVPQAQAAGDDTRV